MRFLRLLPCLLSAAALLPAQVSPPVWQDAISKANEAATKGHSGEAEVLLQKAWGEVQKAGAGSDTFPEGVQMVIDAYQGQGLKQDAVLSAAQTALSQLPPQHPNHGSGLRLAAETYERQQRVVEAAAAFEQVLAQETKTVGAESAEVQETLRKLAALYDRSGDLEKAESILQRLETEPAKAPAMRVRRGFVNMSFSGPMLLMNGSGLGAFYEEHGRLAEAEAAFQAAITRARKTPPGQPALLGALGGYRDFLRNHRRFPEAEQLELQIIALQKNGDPKSPGAVYETQNLAAIYAAAGDIGKAAKTYEENLADVPAGSNERWNLQQGYFSTLLQAKKFPEAEQIANELLTQAPADNSDGMRQNAVSLLVQLREVQGDSEGVQKLREQLNALNPGGINDWDPDGLGPETENAAKLINEGKIETAWTMINDVLLKTRGAEPVKAFNFLNGIVNLADALAAKDQAKADELMLAAQRIQEQFTPLSPFYNPFMFINYAANRQRWIEADRLAKKYLQTLEAANGPDSLALAQPLMQIANLFGQQSHPEDQLAMLQRMLAIHEKSAGANSREVENSLGQVAQAYSNANQWPRAVEVYDRALALSARLNGPTIGYANLLLEVANAYAARQQYDHALELAGRAVDIARQPESEPEIRDAFDQQFASIAEQKAAASKAEVAITALPVHP